MAGQRGLARRSGAARPVLGVSGSRVRTALGAAALVAGSILAGGLLVEAGLRLMRYEPQRFRNTARVVDSKWRALLDCYPTNPRGYFDIDLRDERVRERFRWMAPVRLDAVARRAPWAVELRYNSLRFRDAELGPKPAGVRRVMVLGDSFTEGQGVKEKDTYPRRLEALLNATDSGRWEVRNCGRRATDFPELYAAFEQVLAFEPDVIVYGMVLNDADRSAEFQARQTYVNDWILDRGRILEGGATTALGPLDSRLLAMVHDRVEGYRTSQATLRWYRQMYGQPNRAGWERTEQYLREMNQRARASGARFLVASWPLLVSLDRYPFADVQETIARFCMAAGIPQHDLRPVLQGRPTESLWVHPVDMHPNEIAHRLAAESLVQPVLALR
jgi:GDSL-like lipase/acylhydrolase family protein